jgi:plastocyanin
MTLRSLRYTAPMLGAVVLLGLASGCGGDDDDGGSTASENSIEVEGKQTLLFDSDEYSATAGTIDIKYFSDDDLTHNLLVEGHEEDLQLEVMGDEDEGSIELTAGSYVIYCDIAGHREAGMEATLIVN